MFVVQPAIEILDLNDNNAGWYSSSAQMVEAQWSVVHSRLFNLDGELYLMHQPDPPLTNPFLIFDGNGKTYRFDVETQVEKTVLKLVWHSYFTLVAIL